MERVPIPSSYHSIVSDVGFFVSIVIHGKAARLHLLMQQGSVTGSHTTNGSNNP